MTTAEFTRQCVEDDLFVLDLLTEYEWDEDHICGEVCYFLYDDAAEYERAMITYKSNATPQWSLSMANRNDEWDVIGYYETLERAADAFNRYEVLRFEETSSHTNWIKEGF